MLIWLQITGVITQSISEVKQDFGAEVTQGISFSKLITCCMLNTAGKTSYNESITGYYRTYCGRWGKARINAELFL